MSAASAALPIEVPATATMPRSRLAGAYWAEARYETARMLRTPGFSIPFLGLPVGLYLLVGVVIFGAAIAKDAQAGVFVFAAFSVFGVAGPGMFGFGSVVALEREQGLVRLKRALPMPPAAYLTAKLLMSVLFAALVMATMIAATPLARLTLGTRQALGVACVGLLGSLPFCAIGLFLGTRTSGRSAAAIVNVVYQLMLHLSGIFYVLPKALRVVAPVWPTYHLQQLVFWTMGAHSEGSPLVHAALLAGLTVLLTTASVRRLQLRG